MSEDVLHVECATHGKRRATFLCQHLIGGGEGLGFHCGYNSEAPDEVYPDAWCDACEQMLETEGEWTEHAMEAAGVKMVCDVCYEELRARHWVQDDEAFARLVEESNEYLEARQEELWSKFELEECESYNWNQESGELTFFRDGEARVVADIQFSGSFSTRSNTWLWSWANSSLLEAVKTGVREVRELGSRTGFLKLAAAHWRATEEDGWDMTAITARLLGAVGAYRSPGEGGATFMVITAMRWAGEPRLDVH